MKIGKNGFPEKLYSYANTACWFVVCNGCCYYTSQRYHILKKILIDENTINTLIAKEVVRAYIFSYIFQPMVFLDVNVSD